MVADIALPVPNSRIARPASRADRVDTGQRLLMEDI
jgi:hypothetical protein